MTDSAPPTPASAIRVAVCNDAPAQKADARAVHERALVEQIERTQAAWAGEQGLDSDVARLLESPYTGVVPQDILDGTETTIEELVSYCQQRNIPIWERPSIRALRTKLMEQNSRSQTVWAARTEALTHHVLVTIQQGFEHLDDFEDATSHPYNVLPDEPPPTVLLRATPGDAALAFSGLCLANPDAVTVAPALRHVAALPPPCHTPRSAFRRPTPRVLPLLPPVAWQKMPFRVILSGSRGPLLPLTLRLCRPLLHSPRPQSLPHFRVLPPRVTPPRLPLPGTPPTYPATPSPGWPEDTSLRPSELAYLEFTRLKRQEDSAAVDERHKQRHEDLTDLFVQIGNGVVTLTTTVDSHINSNTALAHHQGQVLAEVASRKKRPLAAVPPLHPTPDLRAGRTVKKLRRPGAPFEPDVSLALAREADEEYGRRNNVKHEILYATAMEPEPLFKRLVSKVL